MKLANRTALVTGAGSGIGRGIAERFAQEGASVALLDIDLAAAEATQKRIDGTSVAIACDVADPESAAQALGEAVESLGGLDVVVNAAGITRRGSVEDLELDDWNATIGVNLTGTMLIVRNAWPHLRRSSHSSIVNVASGAAFRGQPRNAAYCTSKAAVLNLTKCLAIDGAADAIRANCVCPSAVETEMLSGFFERATDPAAARADFLSTIPLGRFGQVADITNAALYLASDDSSWVTGTGLVIDGGVLAT